MPTLNVQVAALVSWSQVGIPLDALLLGHERTGRAVRRVDEPLCAARRVALAARGADEEGCRRAAASGGLTGLVAVAEVAVGADLGCAGARAAEAGVVQGAGVAVTARSAGLVDVEAAIRRIAAVRRALVAVVAIDWRAGAHVRQRAVLVGGAEVGIGALRVAVAAVGDRRVLASVGIAARVGRARVAVVAVERRAGRAGARLRRSRHRRRPRCRRSGAVDDVRVLAASEADRSCLGGAGIAVVAVGGGSCTRFTQPAMTVQKSRSARSLSSVAAAADAGVLTPDEGDARVGRARVRVVAGRWRPAHALRQPGRSLQAPLQGLPRGRARPARVAGSAERDAQRARAGLAGLGTVADVAVAARGAVRRAGVTGSVRRCRSRWCRHCCRCSRPRSCTRRSRGWRRGVQPLDRRRTRRWCRRCRRRSSGPCPEAQLPAWQVSAPLQTLPSPQPVPSGSDECLQPWAGSQVSSVQMLLSSQSTVSLTQPLFTQRSLVVHRLVSPHWPFEVQHPGIGVAWQPSDGEQESVVQSLPSSHWSSVPPRQLPPTHVSSPLQALPSAQEVPFGWSSKTQPPRCGIAGVRGAGVRIVADDRRGHAGAGVADGSGGAGAGTVAVVVARLGQGLVPDGDRERDDRSGQQYARQPTHGRGT